MQNDDNRPWYQRVIRWGQTNLTEIDPSRYDMEWWREHWKRTKIQGVIVNAGGIVAYYPSDFPMQHQAKFLNGRDLYGEISAAAREDGLSVIARMDSNRAHEEFLNEQPGWFARDIAGNPIKIGDLYVACIFSDYYDVYLPNVLREIISRYQPDGFTDNSWAGLRRDKICYCENCSQKFREAHGAELPKSHDWDDPAFKKWIHWNYARRVEVWELNNRVAREAGGPNCLWIGMNSGNLLSQCMSFRDYAEIFEMSELVFLDSQTREVESGFQSNGDMGKLIHGILGWDKLVPESTAMYQLRGPTFRLTSQPAPEARMWAVEGFAGGIQPWWHHIGAYHDDRRQYKTAEPLFQWHEANDEYLINRRPYATVGVVWSQNNMDFFGRDEAETKAVLPYRGLIQALIRSRIPYVPVNANHIERDSAGLSALVLPNMGALSDDQCHQIRQFVKNGGGLVATSESSLYDEDGNRRSDFALADLFGAHATSDSIGAITQTEHNADMHSHHTYLRIHPSLRGRVYGPLTGNEPAITEERHPALRGFDETDLLPFGGRLELIQVDDNASSELTFIPDFPSHPPELSWIDEPTNPHPGIVLNEAAKSGGRVAYLPASMDLCYALYNQPDQGELISGLVRWAANDDIPIKVEGAGMIDCHLYRQGDRIVLHLVNLSSAGAWKRPIEEVIPVGPVQISVTIPDGVRVDSLKTLVSGESISLSMDGNAVRFELPSIADHEICVIE